MQHVTTKAAMAAEPALPSMAKLSLMDRVKATTSIKVVVLCHPRPFQGHWQESVIRKYTETLFADRIKAGETLDFFTLDPVSFPGNTADFPMGGAQNLFKVTKFSSVPRFDMIWAPDCGGEWYQMMEMNGEAQEKQFVSLALTMSLSLKPGGYLMMGKLPFGADTETTLDRAVKLLGPGEAGFARAEHTKLPDPYVAGEDTLTYILVQKMN